MRKADHIGGKRGRVGEYNDRNSGNYIVASSPHNRDQLQERTALRICRKLCVGYDEAVFQTSNLNITFGM